MQTYMDRISVTRRTVSSDMTIRPFARSRIISHTRHIYAKVNTVKKKSATDRKRYTESIT